MSIPKWPQIALSLSSLSRWSFSLLISHKTTSSQIRGCESKALIIRSPCVSFRISSASMASLSEVVTLRFFAAKREKKKANWLEVKNSSIVNTRLPISSLTLLMSWATSSAFKFLPLFSPSSNFFVRYTFCRSLNFDLDFCCASAYPFSETVVLLLQKNASWCFRRHHSILHFQSPSVTLFGPVNQSNLFSLLLVTAIQHVIPYLWNTRWHPSSGHMRSFCSFFTSEFSISFRAFQLVSTSPLASHLINDFLWTGTKSSTLVSASIHLKSVSPGTEKGKNNILTRP